MVEECGADLALQTQIKGDEQNPYNVKEMAKRIRKNEKWNKSSKDILAEIVELKFVSQPSLMANLQGYPKGKFYEATKDPVFGCGYTLAQAGQIKDDKIDTNANQMGRILNQIRLKYRLNTEDNL